MHARGIEPRQMYLPQGQYKGQQPLVQRKCATEEHNLALHYETLHASTIGYICNVLRGVSNSRLNLRQPSARKAWEPLRSGYTRCNCSWTCAHRNARTGHSLVIFQLSAPQSSSLYLTGMCGQDTPWSFCCGLPHSAAASARCPGGRTWRPCAGESPHLHPW